MQSIVTTYFQLRTLGLNPRTAWIMAMGAAA